MKTPQPQLATAPGEPFWYRATVLEVHDGDTVDVWVDLGFRHRWQVAIRLFGINAPELSTPEGVAARDHLNQLLTRTGDLYLRSHKDQADKYGGRWLGELFLGEENINQTMVKDGHAKPYSGKGPKT
jgi:endonuclease YncB( thermonuclease family)